jgi:hypothetical protein
MRDEAFGEAAGGLAAVVPEPLICRAKNPRRATKPAITRPISFPKLRALSPSKGEDALVELEASDEEPESEVQRTPQCGQRCPTAAESETR